MPIVIRCIVLVVGIFAGTAGLAQPARSDSFVLHFAFDRSEIRPADMALLRGFVRDRVSAGVSGDSHVDSFFVTGYTDTIGTPEYNQRLSQRRAMEVGHFLRQVLGADSLLVMRVEGRGEMEPVPGDDSESRRVTIVCWRRPAPSPVVAEVKPDTPVQAPESEPDTVFELNDIRFVANTANLTDAAQMVLPRYINYLLSLRGKYLEIDGYCNSPGPALSPKDPLYILSVQRAKFIYDCLVERGFDSSRLVYKGKGNTNPRNAHPTTRDEMDKNMRVEIRVYRVKQEP